jgi:hypothetical protein
VRTHFGLVAILGSLENRTLGAYQAPTLLDAQMPRSTAYSFYLIFPFSPVSVKAFRMMLQFKSDERERPMSSTHLTDYLWFDSYLNAICETDDMKKAGRILEARSALEERMLSPVRPGSDEEKAIQTAELGLKVLTAERVNREPNADPLQGVPG